MRKYLSYTIVLLAIIFLAACHKKDALFDGKTCSGNCYTLTGRVIDSATNTGLSGGEVKFFFNRSTSAFTFKKYYLGSAVSDANGNYNFTFDGNKFKDFTGHYYTEVSKANMFTTSQNGNQTTAFTLDSTFYNIPFVQNFIFFRPATIKVRVIASTVTNFSYLTIDAYYGRQSGAIVLGGGRTIDTTITWTTAGDLKTFFRGDAKGNGVNIVKRDSVVVPANGTRQVEIRL